MTFSVTILGSGAATPTSQRYPTAQTLQIDERIFMIDCAEGAQMQLRRYKVKIRQIKAIFISHLHGDHVFGLPGQRTNNPSAQSDVFVRLLHRYHVLEHLPQIINQKSSIVSPP